MENSGYDVMIDGVGYTIVPGSYVETGRTQLLERSSPETSTGELDFGLGHPYAQRSWLLGEQQRYAHEREEIANTSAMRYYSGHGVDTSRDGELSLLPAMEQSLVTSEALTSCPMCSNHDGTQVWAFPAGSSRAWVYDGGVWSWELITDVVPPVRDCLWAVDKLYVVDSSTFDSRILVRDNNGTWSRVPVPSLVSEAWGADAYNTANCVVYTNGELYVVTDTAVYAHDACEIVSTYVGGVLACAFEGAVFWTDGSNRVYQYTGYTSRLVMADLPTGSKVEALFPALSRLWVCGSLPDGRAMIFWYQNGQFGVGTYLDKVAGPRTITAGAADIEYVVFADSAYGSIRHYAPGGGFSHYLEPVDTGEGLPAGSTIPTKGLTIGAGKTFLAVNAPTSEHWGIYVSRDDLYVPVGVVTSSHIDLGMPAHKKRWSVITVTCLPLREGEHVTVQWSIDDGATWNTAGYLSTPGDTEETLPIEGAESATIQYRLILNAGKERKTTPRITSVVVRGYPVVRSGRRFAMVVNGGDVVPTKTGARPANSPLVLALRDLALSAKPVTFIDPIGESHRVRVNPFELRIAPSRDKLKIGLLLSVTLDEVEA